MYDTKMVTVNTFPSQIKRTDSNTNSQQPELHFKWLMGHKKNKNKILSNIF